MNIAIVGMEYDLPPNIESDRDLIDVLSQGIDTMIKVEGDGTTVKNHYRFSDHGYHDLDFFKMNKNEYFDWDLQHVYCLELTHRVLDNYGFLNNRDLLKNTGVITAMSMPSNIVMSEEKLETYGRYLNHLPDTASSKIAYNLNLGGMSLNVGSACSSFASAINIACDALARHQLDMAAVTSSKIVKYPEDGYQYIPGAIFSETGICRPFDADADGTTIGSGSFAFLFKRLEDAVRDGDVILAVIDGIGINNDGRDKISYTAPSTNGQVIAINKAYTDPVQKDHVVYIETHGTGTKIGDAIEIESIKRSFPNQELYIGSSKGNWGHLDYASAALSLTKSVILLNHGLIPKQANFENKNLYLADDVFIKIPKETIHMDVGRIGINSFGIGGTNIHIAIRSASVEENIEKSLTEEKLLSEVRVPVSCYTENLMDENLKRIDALLKSYTDIDDRCRLARTLLFDRVIYKHTAIVSIDYRTGTLSRLRSIQGLDESTLCVNQLRSEQAHLAAYRKIGFSLPQQNKQKIATENHDCDTAFSYLANYLNVEEAALSTLKIADIQLESLQLVELVNGLKTKYHVDCCLQDFYTTKKKLTISEFINSNQDTCDISTKKEEIHNTNHALLNYLLHENERCQLDVYGTIDELVISQRFKDKMCAAFGLNDISDDEIRKNLLYILNNEEETVEFYNEYYDFRDDLYLIHPAGGEVFFYANLFPESYYDFNIIFIKFPKKFFDLMKLLDMNTLSQYYVSVIERISQRKNIYLGGYSFGGNIAYDICQKSHLNIKALFLIDSHPYEAYSTADTENIIELNSDAALDIMIDYLGFGDDEHMSDYLKSLSDIWILNHRMLRGMSPPKGKLQLPALIVKCLEKEDKYILSLIGMNEVEKELWLNYLPQKTVFKTIGGNHYSFISNKKSCIDAGHHILSFCSELSC